MIFDTVDIRNSEGSYLAHSLQTQQGRIAKGSLISAEIAAQLLAGGFERVLVARLDVDDVHEDKAALTIAQSLCGNGVALSAARTGRVNLLASHEGLCHFDAQAVIAANAIDEGITVATLPENQWVPLGRMLATVKIIPYAVSYDNLQRVLDTLTEKSISVATVMPHTADLIQTRLGSTKTQVLDKTRRVTENRLVARSVELIHEAHCQHTVDDLLATIVQAQHREPDWLLIVGASAISDRADIIPQAIVAAGGEIDRYGIPVDPGNLLLLGRIGKIKVVGLPGCARSPRYNGLDMVLDRMACNLDITNNWLSGLAVGGLLTEIVNRPAPRINRSEQRKVGAVILAAGSSRRAGSINKLLVPYGAATMIAHVAQVVRKSCADKVIAVTGHQHELVCNALSGTDVECYFNSAHASGMASSVVNGVSQLIDCDAVLVCLGDMPHVTEEVIDKLISSFKSNPEKSIFIPVNNHHRGNPVLFGKVFFDTLLSLEGDAGARKLVQQFPEEVQEVEIENTGVLIDYDTEDELGKLSGQTR